MSEWRRYLVNGILATAIHYGVLTMNIEVLRLPSAGLANFVAAVFGITASFLGSRYFVFRRADMPMLAQAIRFSGLYGVMAAMHGAVLFLWTDRLALGYTAGFMLATLLQMALTYTGNKRLVFGT